MESGPFSQILSHMYLHITYAGLQVYITTYRYMYYDVATKGKCAPQQELELRESEEQSKNQGLNKEAIGTNNF